MGHAKPKLDVDELFTLARDRSTRSRAALVGTVSDLFCDGEQELSTRERTLMAEILRQLVDDVEQSVRVTLAERLAGRDDAPRELVLALANDSFMVAHPILLRSPVLHDGELIEIIHHRTLQHQLAIAMRTSISEAVTTALVATEDSAVVRTLLENGGAQLSPVTLEYLVEQSQHVSAYQQPLLNRDDLGEDLAKRMVCWVSAALRQHILDHYEIDAENLDDSMGATIADLVEDMRARKRVGNGYALAELLAHANALSPRFLIALLREGEVALFEGLLAEMTGLRVTLIRRFLYEPGGEALAIACKAIHIDKADFASIFLLSRQARPGDHSVDPEELSRILDIFDRLRPTAVMTVLQRWRLDPDYLYSVVQVGNTATRRKAVNE